MACACFLHASLSLPFSLSLTLFLGDLSGSPDFFDVRNEFHSHAQGTLLVYDVHSLISFQNLSHWLDEHARFGGRPFLTIVCANKVDGEVGNGNGEGRGSVKRVVSEADGRRFAEKHGFTYFETSAKSGQNVNELFQALFKGIAAASPTAIKG